jgi:hypothetical protein
MVFGDEAKNKKQKETHTERHERERIAEHFLKK